MLLIKRAQRPENKVVGKLIVGERTYYGDSVPDGMYESVRQLKTEGQDLHDPEFSHSDFSKEYKMILDICRAGLFQGFWSLSKRT